MYRLFTPGDESSMTDFGPLPKLNFKQKLLIATGQPAYVRHMKPAGYRDFVPVFVAKCPKPGHGLYLDKENGYGRYLLCPKCFDELQELREQERAKLCPV
jgi:hypothetical protein